MSSPTRRIVALAATAVLGLAACGDDGNDAGSGDQPVPAGTVDAAEVGTIVDVASSLDDFTTLVAAVEAAGLVDTLSSDGPFTVFAPTNEAFEIALGNLGLTAEELLANTDTLTEILTYHVIDGAVPAETVLTLDGQTATTLNGADVSISIDGDTVMVNDATVTAIDVVADNGIIHVIDSVLMPPTS